MHMMIGDLTLNLITKGIESIRVANKGGNRENIFGRKYRNLRAAWRKLQKLSN